MPRQRRSPSAGQQTEAIVEAGGELRDAKGGGTGRRQLYRQRYAVELPADVAIDRPDCRSSTDAARLPRERAVNSWTAPYCHGSSPPGGHGKWRHGVDMLAFRPQRLAAVAMMVTPARTAAGLGQLRRRIDHVLAGIQHEQ